MKIARIDFSDDIVSLIVISGIDLKAVDRTRYTERQFRSAERPGDKGKFLALSVGS